jgi:uncharacterized protein YndB with AHSA1/START domain
MDKPLVATAKIVIDAPAERIWHALISPDLIKRYMFGTDVTSDWKEGSRITWKGQWDGKAYEDHGKIVRFEPASLLAYTHFSPLAGLPDEPENYHHVTIELRPHDAHTHVTLRQDNNASEEARAHSEKNWNSMLDGLKKVVEG